MKSVFGHKYLGITLLAAVIAVIFSIGRVQGEGRRLRCSRNGF